MTAGPFAELAPVYAALGVPVFPCGIDKRPLVERGFHSQTTNPALIEEWVRRHPAANIGHAPTAFVVIDVDGYRCGYETMARLAARRPLPVATRSVMSGRDASVHLWYRRPPVKKLVTTLGPGVDVRSWPTGYVLMPGSVHPGGTVYHVELDREPIELPEAWQVELVASPGLSFLNARRPRAVPGDELLERLAHHTERQPEGNRNNYLHWAACRAAEHGVDYDLAEAALVSGAVVAGLDPRAARATVRSAYRTVGR